MFLTIVERNNKVVVVNEDHTTKPLSNTMKEFISEGILMVQRYIEVEGNQCFITNSNGQNVLITIRDIEINEMSDSELTKLISHIFVYLCLGKWVKVNKITSNYGYSCTSCSQSELERLKLVSCKMNSYKNYFKGKAINLTKFQRQIIIKISEGKTLVEIAKEFSTAQSTISYQIKDAKYKVGFEIFTNARPKTFTSKGLRLLNVIKQEGV